MEDDMKTKEELLRELKELRRQHSGLDMMHSDRRWSPAYSPDGEAFFRSLVENARDIITVLDASGSFLYQSPNTEQMLGYKPEELIGKSAFEYIYPEDRSRVMDAFNYVIGKPGAATSVEYRFRAKDGSWLNFESVGKMLLANVAALGVVIISRDITDRKRTEEVMLRSERRLRRAEEVANFGNWELLVDEQIIQASDGAAIIYGCEGKEWQLSDVQKIVLPEYRPKLDKALTELIEHNRPYDVEFKIHRPTDGEIIDIHSLAEYDPIRRIVFGVIHDITEHKQSEEQLRLFIKHAPASLAMFDREMRYLGVSRRWLSDYNLIERELSGLSHYEVFPDIPERWKSIHRRALAGEVLRDDNDRFDRADGSVQWLRWEVRPWYDASGDIAGIVIFREDITERKQMEAALLKAKELDQILVDALPYAAMLIQYPERTILNANRLAKDAGAVIGGICYRDFCKNFYLASGETQCSFCRADDMFKKQETIIADVLCVNDKWWTVYWIPVKENIYLHFVIDISERKKAEKERKNLEEQLHHAQKMEGIGILAGGVAHDFNNILMAMIGYGTMAQMMLKGDTTTQGYIQEMLDAANRAAELTRGLLAFSRKQVIAPVQVDLNEIVEKIDKMLRRILREDIELGTVLSAGELPVLVDIGQIEQVLMNLATNARDAMPDGGRLVIQTDTVNLDNLGAEAHISRNAGMYAELTVSDTGVGMDQGTKGKIFEPFFTTKEVGKGTGLGLSMVYGMIKQHNGNINVYSELGKGTTFKIHLPLVQKKREAIAEPLQTLPVGKGETIIIAEDERQVRESMRLFLQKNGYKVIKAKNGEEAVSKFKENRGAVSLILLDVIMPVKNGREAYEEIKGIEPGVKTIFMSGYTDDIISQKGILEEGVDFISKPINPDTLMRKIRDVLDS